jgi:putative heme-binding domain-containing protein
MSYKPFLDNIRQKALDNVPEQDFEKFSEISGFYSPVAIMSDLPKPIGPGKNYTMSDMWAAIGWGDNELAGYEGSVEDGYRAFQAALCSSCHRMNGEGSGSGPDLTNVDTRFEPADLMNAIISPSEEISDQYEFTMFAMNDGSTITGRILEQTESSYKIYQSPFDVTNTTELLKVDVKSKSPSPISPMPANLLNGLNAEEVSHLIAYLLSGGQSSHEYYQ